MRRCGHVHRLHSQRVDSRVIHARCQRAGRGIEILHLLGVVAHIAHVFRQLNSLVKTRSRVRAHQIRHQKLFHAGALVRLLVLLAKPLIDEVARLAHIRQNRIADMLRRHFKLTAYVVFHQFIHEFLTIRVRHKVVEANAAAHEHLLHAGQHAQLAQKLQVVGMGRFARLAYGGRKTALAGAGTALHLLAASGCAEVRGGTAHIVNIAFEIGVVNDVLRFFQQRGMTARLHNAPLMERERAKSAFAETAPAAGQGKLHF